VLVEKFYDVSDVLAVKARCLDAQGRLVCADDIFHDSLRSATQPVA
jgi:hypothetical protein